MDNQPTTRRASLLTHGCRLNQTETNLIREQLESRGFEVVPFGEEAELGIINTCTVTREAEAKCRQSIRGFIRKNPEAFTAVIGCYSQMGANEIAGIKGVDLIVGNHDKMAVLDYADQGKLERPLILRDRIQGDEFTMSFAGELPSTQRANLKVQDGCDFMCSFCIIPFARGRARPRALGNLLEEAKQLAESGVKELVITGVNIGTYALDKAGQSITILEVVDALNAIPGIERIRISSIEPTTIPSGLIDRMAAPDHSVLPYLHIPLQSGTDTILEIMRRRYRIAEFLDFINDAATRVPNLCIGTDIMVGHPGETEELFEETCRVFLESPLHYCHVFPYSERPGTLATKRTDHVPMKERKRRSARLRRLSEMKRHDFYSSYLGKQRPVLWEHSPEPNIWTGLTDNYIRVITRNESNLLNTITQAEIVNLMADVAEAHVL